MHLSDQVKFACADLAESLGIREDAIGLVTKVYDAPIEPYRLDVLFPGSNTLIHRCGSEFVEAGSVISIPGSHQAVSTA